MLPNACKTAGALRASRLRRGCPGPSCSPQAESAVQRLHLCLGGPPGPHCLLLIRAVIVMWGLGGAESTVDPQRAPEPVPHPASPLICIPVSPLLAHTSRAEASRAALQDIFGDWGAVCLASCPPLPCWCLGKKTPRHESRYPVIHTGHLRGLGPSRKLRWGKCDGGGFISSGRGTEPSVQDVAGVKGRGSA